MHVGSDTPDQYAIVSKGIAAFGAPCGLQNVLESDRSWQAVSCLLVLQYIGCTTDLTTCFSPSYHGSPIQDIAWQFRHAIQACTQAGTKHTDLLSDIHCIVSFFL
jgi:hypothetical protein